MIAPVRAGPLAATYDAGTLRTITLGGVEVLRGIFPAVRDANWQTLVPTISDEQIEADEHSFCISYSAFYRSAEIELVASVRIRGDRAGTLVFTLDCAALRACQINRIGLCVLHPIRECAGQPCVLVDTQGTTHTTQFPDTIAPHQPFVDLRALRWHPAPRLAAELVCEGDTFETEDQRNWSDASFKTYSRPLALPYPYTVAPGESIAQSVTLSTRTGDHGYSPAPGRSGGWGGEVAFPSTAAPLPAAPPPSLPPIGVAHDGRSVVYSAAELAAIQALRLDHLRIDLDLSTRTWHAQLAAASTDARHCGAALVVAAIFGAHPSTEALALGSALRSCGSEVRSILMLQRDHATTPPGLVEQIGPVLRAALPAARLLAGTQAYFAQVNRNPAIAQGVDGVAYSLNPQVHAADDQTIMENLAAQGDTVRSALRFARSVHVGPVTLRAVRNFDATSDAPAPQGALPWNVDVRQPSAFTAAWTRTSIEELARAGVARITIHELSGMRGLFLPASEPVVVGFPATPGTLFPVYHVLHELCGGGRGRIL